MPYFVVNAKVDQIVTKQIQLLVKAASAEEAEDKSRTALSEFPKTVKEDGVRRILVKQSNYWVPKNIEFVGTVEEKDTA